MSLARAFVKYAGERTGNDGDLFVYPPELINNEGFNGLRERMVAEGFDHAELEALLPHGAGSTIDQEKAKRDWGTFVYAGDEDDDDNAVGFSSTSLAAEIARANSCLGRVIRTTGVDAAESRVGHVSSFVLDLSPEGKPQLQFRVLCPEGEIQALGYDELQSLLSPTDTEGGQLLV
jgi:hypothetical protein